MAENHRKKGAYYEELASQYVKEQGAVLLERNFRSKMGEIDLIFKDGKYLVFAEVKQRDSSKSGFAESAVHDKKQQIISRVSDYYRLQKHISEDSFIRYDVIAISGTNIHWIKNAFPYVPCIKSW